MGTQTASPQPHPDLAEGSHQVNRNTLVVTPTVYTSTTGREKKKKNFDQKNILCESQTRQPELKKADISMYLVGTH